MPQHYNLYINNIIFDYNTNILDKNINTKSGMDILVLDNCRKFNYQKIKKIKTELENKYETEK